MRWTREEKRRLAAMVLLRATELQLQALKASSSAIDMLEKTDQLILEHFKRLGWEVPSPGSWELLDHEDVMIFRHNRTHLFFSTVQGRILKVRKDIAEKTLVLGLP